MCPPEPTRHSGEVVTDQTDEQRLIGAACQKARQLLPYPLPQLRGCRIIAFESSQHQLTPRRLVATVMGSFLFIQLSL